MASGSRPRRPCGGRYSSTSTAQFDALQPVEDEQRAFDPTQLAKGHGQAILARVAAELAQHLRGGDCGSTGQLRLTKPDYSL